MQLIQAMALHLSLAHVYDWYNVRCRYNGSTSAIFWSLEQHACNLASDSPCMCSGPLDSSNTMYLMDGSVPLWPTANGSLLSIVFHFPQRQRYTEFLKQGILLIMNLWSFAEMQQLANRSYPANATVSNWQNHMWICATWFAVCVHQQLETWSHTMTINIDWQTAREHKLEDSKSTLVNRQVYKKNAMSVVLCSGRKGTTKEEECLAQCLRLKMIPTPKMRQSKRQHPTWCSPQFARLSK